MLVNDPLLLHHKIGDIFAHDLTFIQDLMPLLLSLWMPLSRNSTQRQFS